MRALSSQLNAITSHVIGPDTEAVFTAGGAPTITDYQVDLSAYGVMVGAVVAALAARNDDDLMVDFDGHIKLDGTSAARLSADGKTYDTCVCAILVSGAVEEWVVFGDEADDASEVAPTAATARAALAAASITGYDDNFGVITARVKVKRVATDTINYVAGDPTTAAEKQERKHGTLGT
jgi:hypothetical protein